MNPTIILDLQCFCSSVFKKKRANKQKKTCKAKYIWTLLCAFWAFNFKTIGFSMDFFFTGLLVIGVQIP